jgi:hypothetical protein
MLPYLQRKTRGNLGALNPARTVGASETALAPPVAPSHWSVTKPDASRRWRAWKQRRGNAIWSGLCSDLRIARDIKEFQESHDVFSVAMAGTIIGCPH